MILHGETIYLRPLSQHDLPLFHAWANSLEFQSEFNFFGLQRENYLERGFQENGLVGPHNGMLAVVTYQEQVVGDVSYRRVGYGPNEGSTAYSIGIALAPEHRGQGYGVEAQRLITEYLFAVSPVMRVEATTDITNLAEQRALEKAGFTRDGVLRKAQWRTGGWHDMCVYSKLRDE